jgi:hypothetical protein
VTPSLTFNARAIVKLDPRRERVYRLAIRGLCDRCGTDRAEARAHVADLKKMAPQDRS